MVWKACTEDSRKQNCCTFLCALSSNLSAAPSSFWFIAMILGGVVDVTSYASCCCFGLLLGLFLLFFCLFWFWLCSNVCALHTVQASAHTHHLVDHPSGDDPRSEQGQADISTYCPRPLPWVTSCDSQQKLDIGAMSNRCSFAP